MIGDTSSIAPNGDGKTLVGGLIMERMPQPLPHQEPQEDGGEGGSMVVEVTPPQLYKLLIGTPDRLYHILQAVQTGPDWPNLTNHLVPLAHSKLCSRQAYVPAPLLAKCLTWLAPRCR